MSAFLDAPGRYALRLSAMVIDDVPLVTFPAVVEPSWIAVRETPALQRFELAFAHPVAEGDD
ncbi:MAG: hypothetical protein CMJ84_12225 [Planctomycetes bacterium]|nr:hypothetical protein [Planctomycetota bacterium]MDP6407883.1 hypothetical protein [Planctomycetota bacterium]